MDISASQKKLCYTAHQAEWQQCCFPAGTRDALQYQCINSCMFSPAVLLQNNQPKKTPPPPVTQLRNPNLLKTYMLHHITPGQLLGRPSLKGHKPSCFFTLLGHVRQNRSKETKFCFLITCSPFSDPEGEKTSAKSTCCYTGTSMNRAETKSTTTSAHPKTSSR